MRRPLRLDARQAATAQRGGLAAGEVVRGRWTGRVLDILDIFVF